MKRHRFKGYAQIALASLIALTLTGCVPIAEISNKIKQVQDGTAKVGPSWPVSLSVPVFQGFTLDVGSRLAGFETESVADGFSLTESYEFEAIDKPIHPATFKLPAKAFTSDPQEIVIRHNVDFGPKGDHLLVLLPIPAEMKTVNIALPKELQGLKVRKLDMPAPTITISGLPPEVWMDIRFEIDGVPYVIEDLDNRAGSELTELHSKIMEALFAGNGTTTVTIDSISIEHPSLPAESEGRRDVEVTISLPEGDFSNITYVDFDTETVTLDEVIEVVADSGKVEIELIGFEAGEGGLEVAIIDVASDDELFRIAFAEGERKASLDFAGLRLTGEVYAEIKGAYDIDAGAKEVKMELSIEEPLRLKSAVMPKAEVEKLLADNLKLDPVSYTFTWPGGIDRSGTPLTLSGSLTAQGIPEGVVVKVQGNVGVVPFVLEVRNGKATALDPIFDELEAFAKGNAPSIDVRFTAIKADVEVGEVEIDFAQPLTLSLTAKAAIGAAGDAADDAILSFSSVFEIPANVPDVIEGGALVMTVNNMSSLSGRLDIWFSAGDDEASGAPDASLLLQAGQNAQHFEMTLGRAAIDLFQPDEEVRVTLALSDLSTTRPVAANDTIVIDAYATIAGRVN